MITSIMSSSAGKKAFGSIIRMWLLTLLVLIICTCSGVKSTSVNQTFANQTDYFTYSGRLVRPITDPMVCATLRTGVLGFHLWPQANALIWQPYQATLDLGYYQSLVLTQRRCLQTRWYRYQLITPSFSNQFRTEWTVQRQNLRIEYPQRSIRVKNSRRTSSYKKSTGSIPRSTGKIRATTRTTVRSSNFSSTMRAANGSVRRTSSTTGGSRKPAYD